MSSHIFCLCPAAPPANSAQRPALSEGRIHESILGATPSKGMCRKLPTGQPRLVLELIDVFLNRVVGHHLLRVDDTVGANGWKYEFILASKLAR